MSKNYNYFHLKGRIFLNEICKGLLFLFLTSLFFSCGSIRTAIILSKTSVINLPKKKSLMKFDNSFSLVILKVTIKGKSYRFVYDTGAGITLVSKDAAKAIGLKKVTDVTVADSQKSSQKLSVVVIDSMYVGNMCYTKVGAVVNDFSKIPQLSCLNIDGILGINVIKLSNWKINYDSTTVDVSDINNSLTEPNSFKSVSFNPNKQKMPCIDFSVQNMKETFLIDMGDNGESVALPSKVNLDKKAVDIMVGYSASGLYGSKMDTTEYYRTDLTNPEISMSDVSISQPNNSKFLIGTGFLEKRFSCVVFDFKTNQLFVEDKAQKDKQILSYGFSPQLVGNKIIVGAKFLDFSADINKLSVGDTIVGINNVIYNGNNSCQLLNEMLQSKYKKALITLSISKNNRTTNFTLTPKLL